MEGKRRSRGRGWVKREGEKGETREKNGSGGRGEFGMEGMEKRGKKREKVVSKGRDGRKGRGRKRRKGSIFCSLGNLSTIPPRTRNTCLVGGESINFPSSAPGFRDRDDWAPD